MKKKNIVLLSTGVLATLSVGALGFVGNYFYNLALNPKTSKDIIFGKPEESEDTIGEVVNEDVNW
ncbi:alpha/beta hydrolase, partial [Clostridium perfringens]|nr:alpha/beta hydrolase [Clostridium perfringens]